MSLCVLGVAAAAAPTASADTGAPVFSCRGSAGYLEAASLPRVEPVTANAVAPSAANPDGDTAQCANDRGGLPSAVLPPGANPGVQLTLQSLFAETSITPELGAARTQTATSSAATALDPLSINLGTAQAATISASALTSSARATCVNGAPVLTGTSQVVNLTINGTVINIPTNQDNFVIDLLPLVRIVANEQIATTNAAGDRTLVRRALHIQVLGVAPAPPVANIVLAESKVDTHGAVCAPPAPPPTCPAGSVPRPGSNPLVCVVTQTAPCPAGSTPDPNAGGACVIMRVTPSGPCPQGSIDDPNSNNCVFIVERPCPSGAKPDPTTRVCVVTVSNDNNGGGGTSGSGGNGTNGSNGGIGSANGPRVTCGRLSLHFVTGGRRTLNSRFGTRQVTRGRLVTCGSNPRSIVGARISVVHVLPGGKRLTKTGLRSRPGGRLTLILPLNLRTRTIEYSYRPDLTKQRVSSRVNLRITVRNRKGRILR